MYTGWPPREFSYNNISGWNQVYKITSESPIHFYDTGPFSVMKEDWGKHQAEWTDETEVSAARNPSSGQKLQSSDSDL